jgi:hypothetical protein
LAYNLAIDDHGAGGGRGKGVRRFSPRSVAIVTLRRGKRRRSGKNRERGSDEKLLHDSVSKIVARPCQRHRESFALQQRAMRIRAIQNFFEFISSLHGQLGDAPNVAEALRRIN